MTVELWYGSKPKHRGEQNVLIELYNFLEPQKEHFVLLSTFYAGQSHEIDFLILKRNGIFVVELKNFWSPLVGRREGPWYFIRPNGEKQKFRNPFKQVRSSSFGWQDWCRDNRHKFEQLAGKSRDERCYEPSEFIVISPDIDPKSQISIGDHPVSAVGLSKFRTALMIRSISGLDFTTAELQTIPQLLDLTRWHINPPPPSDKTVKLGVDDFRLPDVQMLVARDHEFSQTVLHLEKDVITIGRDTDNDLVIENESISRKHAELRQRGGRWIVRDLDSLNGTHVSYGGDPRIERAITGENAIKNGSIVRFGNASYTVLLS